MKTYNIEVRTDDKSRLIASKLESLLLEKGLLKSENPDIVIVVGGDGSFLHAVHKYQDQLSSTAFIGLHTGTLGFLTDYKAEEYEKLASDIAQLTPQIQEYRLLEGKCEKGNFLAVNEITIQSPLKTAILDLYADEEYVETIRGNGVCLSGQLGSTSYNRSLNGAIIQNGLELLQLCEISGIRNSIYKSLNSPIIFNPKTRIVLKSKSFERSVMTYDHLYIDLDNITELEIRLSKQKLRVARYKPYSYNQHLRTLY